MPNHRKRYFPPSISVIILAFLLLINCGKSQTIPTITPGEVKTRLESTEKLTIIDVRSEAEFTGELGHIPGSILRPLPEINKWMYEFSDLKNEEIIVVCRSGNRSSRATQYLQEQGFSNVKNMSGGMLEWNRNNYRVEK